MLELKNINLDGIGILQQYDKVEEEEIVVRLGKCEQERMLNEYEKN